MAREKNAKKKAAANKGSQKASIAASLTVICQICRQSFMQTAALSMLEEHATSKHAKKTPKDCFPDKF